MQGSRKAVAVSLMSLLLGAIAAPVVARDSSFSPTAPGKQVRYDGWNSDGAPRPPAMWRGHGGTTWADHYLACRHHYGARYDYRTDMVPHGRSRRRCAL